MNASRQASHDALELISLALDRSLSAEDQTALDSHLAECPGCRQVSEDLRWTHAQLKTIAPVEVPPWLASKIMARVRAEAAPKPAFWRRFLLPLVLKPQLQVASLLLIAATGYFLMKSRGLEPSAPRLEMKATDTQKSQGSPPPPPPGEAPADSRRFDEESSKAKAPDRLGNQPTFAPPPASKLSESGSPSAAPAPAPVLAAPAASGELRSMDVLENLPQRQRNAAGTAALAPGVAGGATGAAAPAQRAKQEAAPPPVAESPKPSVADAKAAAKSSARTEKKARKEDRMEPETTTVGVVAQAEADTSSTLPTASIRLEVRDLGTAQAAIERELARVGATLLPRRDGGPARQVIVRLEARRLRELLAGLGRLGTVVQQPLVPKDKDAADSVLMLSIRW